MKDVISSIRQQVTARKPGDPLPQQLLLLQGLSNAFDIAGPSAGFHVGAETRAVIKEIIDALLHPAPQGWTEVEGGAKREVKVMEDAPFQYAPHAKIAFPHFSVEICWLAPEYLLGSIPTYEQRRAAALAMAERIASLDTEPASQEPGTVGQVREAIKNLPDDAKVILWVDVDGENQAVDAGKIVSFGPQGQEWAEVDNSLHIYEEEGLTITVSSPQYDEDGQPICTNPGGHEFPKDIEETDRCLCIHCGADGDA
jgi:hypothetical protein